MVASFSAIMLIKNKRKNTKKRIKRKHKKTPLESEAQFMDTFTVGVWTFLVVAVEENGGEVGSSVFSDISACFGCKMHT